MNQLALHLGPPMMSRPVINKTGIEGTFNFTLDLGRHTLDSETGKPIVDGMGKVDWNRLFFER